MSLQGYFDYNATTPMCQQAIDAFNSTLGHFGNPSSKYTLTNVSKQGLANARKQTAKLVGCDPSELVFTSGGTEANNWAIKGALTSCGAIGRVPEPVHIIVSAIEHSSVLEIAAYFERVFNFEVTRLKPNTEGVIIASLVESALKPNTRLVSIMLVNNELGTLQPIQEISDLLKGKGIHFHVDGVQAVGKIPVCAHSLGMDTMSFSGHKFYGPKGVGGLYIRHGVTVEPLMHGGGQERGVRGGTEAVASIVAMGVAADVIYMELSEMTQRMTSYRETLIRLLKKHIPSISFHGPSDQNIQVPNTISTCIDGIRAEALAAILDSMYGIQVSLGSACSNNKIVSLSHVLAAIGLNESTIKSTIRVSLGRYTTEDSLKSFVDAMTQSVQTLRRISTGLN